VDFEVRQGGLEDIERLEPLWHALREHHISLPEMPAHRDPEASWNYRSGQYREGLTKDEYTLLLAERDGEPIGYGVVSIGHGAATWDLGDRTAELETLSVLPSERGSGVGQALTEAAAEVAREAGVRTLLVGVAYTNEGALNFYERAGFKPFYVLWARED
jgi:ribosomal protein S18 acetylase RimI-like enzyme